MPDPRPGRPHRRRRVLPGLREQAVSGRTFGVLLFHAGLQFVATLAALWAWSCL